MIIKSQLIAEARLSLLLDECQQLCSIVAKSIVTSKTKRMDAR